MLDVLRTIVQEVNAVEDLGTALETIVARVRVAMGTDVCTVYMRDHDTNRYVFAATEGLNREFVGTVSLAAHEGLVGQVAQREEPINLMDAGSHPNYHFVPDVGEELYNAFLAVPIIHQREVLGVLVVQQKARRRFDESEEAFLVTLSAQLAGVIAHAQATGAFVAADETELQEAKFSGIAGAPGIAIGEVVIASLAADLYAVPHRKARDRRAELRLFKKCLMKVRKDIERVQATLAERLPPEERALFDVYLGILEDSAIGGEVASKIKAGEWAQGALSQVMIGHIKAFERMEESYLRERAVDIKDLGTRVLAYLQEEEQDEQVYPEATVLVGEELSASMLADVPSDRLVGLISVKGSGNSHVAILARAMGIPTVMGAVDLPFTLLEGRELIIDGYYGTVYVNPSDDLRRRFADALAQDRAVTRDLESLKDTLCTTRDGLRFPLWVNTGLMTDVARSLDQGAEGVGLYRTEVTFLLQERFPSEEEQRQIYREQLAAFAPLPVTMRTLDIGGDKSLPYFPIDEDNPFLGWRGIRVTLDHPEILLAQVRAMLKASEGLNNLRIMLPMITNVEELDEAIQFIERAYCELLEEGFNIERAPIGVMVEVPAAVYQARELARRVDFLSVGSNDLTQYLLAVDRNNSRVADLYHSFHPAVLQALHSVAKAAGKEGKPVGICGELAGDPGAAILLLAMGYDVLSMNANSLSRVKLAVQHFSLDEAKKVLKKAMTLPNSAAVVALLEKKLTAVGMGHYVHSQLDSVN